jgi:hypothetical protein
MRRSQLMSLFCLAAALGCGVFSVAYSQQQSAVPTGLLTATRQSATDLEIAGTPAGVSGLRSFVSYEKLLTLPQITTTISDDENFSELRGIPVSGVDLDVLRKALGVPPSLTFLTALCSDAYAGMLSGEFVATHHPMLVLKINGITGSDWAKQTHHQDFGRYFIASQTFVPSYRIGSFAEPPQIPTDVVLLRFSTQAFVDSALASHKASMAGSTEAAGLGIARVTCLKCHNASGVGGTKGSTAWSKLASDAAADPATFQKWIVNPKSVDPKSLMPGYPNSDQATLSALTSYFQSFGKE